MELKRIFEDRVPNVLGEFIGKIQKINQKYSKPSIKLSRGAKLALFLLEVYLFFLVALLAYKFWTIIHGGSQ